MGIYTEYLDAGLLADPRKLSAERKKQLKRISDIRGRAILSYAVDVTKHRLPININYSDLLPFRDQLTQLKGSAVDLIIETPGGSGETAEDIVKLLRGQFQNVGVIIPGMAKSAGTLITMAADEILMEPVSALGPIDAQIMWQGKQFSAHALLEGMEKIKAEVTSTGTLNRAYVPILQNISPGELQNAEHALDFARDLVTEWLATFKFKNWTTHSSTGQPVTIEERKQRAREIADQLRDQTRWKTHGRSLKIGDLRQMRLLVTDYSENAPLCDAIRRYFTLLQMTLSTNVYKIFETPTSQVMRLEVVQAPNVFGQAMPMAGSVPAGLAADANVNCAKCGTAFVVQARFDTKVPARPGAIQLPDDNLVRCPGQNCTFVHNLSQLRAQLEAQTGRKVISSKGVTA
jgi:hypothetical protein